jgi:hypothetical protein
MDPLPEELEIRFREELRGGEQLVWSGQPIPGRFMRSAIPIVLFGIPFTGFALFWIATASGMLSGSRGGGDGDGFGIFSFFPLFGIPFLLIGLGMLTAPIWMRRRARRTCYALTNQRAIVWTPGFLGGMEVRSYQAPDLDRMTRRDYGDGSGDLILEEFITTTRDSDGSVRSRRNERGFLGIADVRQVEDLIRSRPVTGVTGGTFA